MKVKLIRQHHIKSFQKKILDWYELHQRDLPWRYEKDPYKVLVSETMLQQTQVDRVIPYYNQWIKKFPTIEKCARAQKKTILTMWSGLGYNSRALRLQQCAQVLTKEKKQLPKKYEELIALPGIGPYTANAILAFAYNEAVPVVDTNIRRVLIHEFKLSEETSQEVLEDLSRKCIPKNKACMWFNAVMDYGATHATARKTKVKSLGKQGAFEGSDRAVRGQIIRLLTKSKMITKKEIKDTSKEQLIKVIAKMKKEGIIKIDGDTLRLA